MHNRTISIIKIRNLKQKAHKIILSLQKINITQQ